MGRRRAVASTIVSVIIFTTLIFANAALYSAGGTYLSSSVLSASQVREYDYASLLSGLSAYSSLSHIQGFLQANPFDCNSPASVYLGALAGATVSTGKDQGLEYSEASSWAYTPISAGASDSTPSPGETSLVASFAGFSPGALNAVVSTFLNESELGGLPKYTNLTTQTVHIPIPFDSDLARCSSTLAALRSSLGSLGSCNSSRIDQAVARVRSESAGQASVSMGASGQSSPAIGTGVRCDLSYWVTITERGVEGVSGTFDWTLQGSGSLST
ncbi:MAG: hypothetical protein OK456_07280 [Thaumarchaeota archaeon]|nr:hypothetical protein [Nitrososphaerota archaeon]